MSLYFFVIVLVLGAFFFLSFLQESVHLKKIIQNDSDPLKILSQDKSWADTQ